MAATADQKNELQNESMMNAATTTATTAVSGTDAVAAIDTTAITNRLNDFLESILAKHHFELVDTDFHLGREAKLVVYIDRTDSQNVNVDDCAIASRALDEPLDQNADINALFAQGYELEISSPGLERPLRKITDYTKFNGEKARIITHRALFSNECENADYVLKNPKQKKFYGFLRGVYTSANALGEPLMTTELTATTKQQPLWVRLGLVPEDGLDKKTFKPGKAPKKAPPKEIFITIPFSLIAKAHLERDFEKLKNELLAKEREN
jgi:ribosome maturation factor RimP